MTDSLIFLYIMSGIFVCLLVFPIAILIDHDIRNGNKHDD